MLSWVEHEKKFYNPGPGLKPCRQVFSRPGPFYFSVNPCEYSLDPSQQDIPNDHRMNYFDCQVKYKDILKFFFKR